MRNLIKTAVIGFAAYKAYDYLSDKGNRKMVEKYVNRKLKDFNLK